MTLSEFFEKRVSRWKKPIFEAKSFIQLDYSTALKPADYLRFATKDLEQDLEHYTINALSNAKRAIDCHVDNLFIALGLKSPRSFPDKLALVETLGLLAPRIVKKVVRVRNLLEHQYYRPNPPEVEDAVDIASLFVEVAARPFRSFMDTYFVADDVSAQRPTHEEIKKAILTDEPLTKGYTFTESMYVEFSKDDKSISLDLISKNRCVKHLDINSSHPAYLPIVGFTIRHDMDHDTWDESKSAVAFLGLLRQLKIDP